MSADLSSTAGDARPMVALGVVSAPIVSTSRDQQAIRQQSQPGILVLDDDPFMVEMLSRMLFDMGFKTVRAAEKADAALEILAHDAPKIDVIICDLNMPEMDGIEFLQALNSMRLRVSVILLSGEGVRTMHTVQKLLGGSGLVVLGALEKPAGRLALHAMLNRWQSGDAIAQGVTTRSFTPDELLVAARNQEWVLHYQPKVELKTGSLVGVEALIRWNHPKHGLVYPDAFIAVAEDCGAIDAMTEWVLNAAMTQVASWQASGLRLQMAINLSMENLRSPKFAQRVCAIARRTGVLPQDVTLEITESRLMSTCSTPLESLVRLRMQRFGLSIDDFGTGHSSLVQLRDVPFTELKVDRGFVSSARYNQVIRPILEGSIGIAKRMDMRAVAEGVETEDDWHLLREIGCDLAQGWFIAKPMGADKIPGWCEQWELRRVQLVGDPSGDRP